MFTAREAVGLVGISLGQLRHLERQGVVQPSARRGRLRLYGLVELIKLDLTKTLRDAGLELRRFKPRLQAILALLEKIARPHGNLVVLCEKATIRWQIFPDNVAEHDVDPEERVKYSAEALRQKVLDLFPAALQPQLRLVRG